MLLSFSKEDVYMSRNPFRDNSEEFEAVQG